MTISKTEHQAATLEQQLARTRADLMRQRVEQAAPLTAAKRQSRVDLVTISNTEWLDGHTARFVYLARRAMPDARVHLLHIGSENELARCPVLDEFDSVKSCEPSENIGPGYLGYNAPRYGLCSLFGLDEVVYIDPDVDIVADISHILDDCEGALGWCRSPVEPDGFGEAMDKCGLPRPKVWANSGTLVLRGDFYDQYAMASELAVASGVSDRMVGNFSFSVMLQSGGVDHREIPYKYGTIWWDKSNYARALALHYCNDKGKARRMALDSVWIG